MSYTSETSKYREAVLPYCTGNGIDLGSGGDPVKHDGCISFDLGGEKMADLAVTRTVNMYGDAQYLNGMFRGEVFDYIYASHLLEDFDLIAWPILLRRWSLTLKHGGHLILLLPDKKLYHEHTPVGANQNHKYEPTLGELTLFFAEYFKDWTVIEERLLEPYTILFVVKKPL